ncbi:ATP-binding protein [Undibacterium flavidum]|uniref:histidine kinase n=1 Tax=Undibacterium flavidum TaxID=2762297 RepID=A0ABR6YFM5_9BURK|nr:ATP-binding protein [Undibacterium flavidum]MBC3875337.1 response regulator [Undibacterium flavidum]
MKNIQLKLFLPFAIGVLVLLPALLITWFGYRAAQQTAIDAANAVMAQASIRASDAADADLAEPTRLLNYFSSYGDAVNGEPDPQNFTSLDRFEEVAWRAMRSTRLVKFLGFANLSGEYRAINVYDDDALPEVLVLNPGEEFRRHFRSAYPLDRRMMIGKDKQAYVANSRPWFSAAMQASDPTGIRSDRRAWTDVYPSFSRNQLQVAHSTVVRNTKREIIGVVALDVSFKLLSTSLHNLEISPNAIAFIVDSKGDLVATSVETMLLGAPDVPKISALQANSPLIRNAMRYLPERIKTSRKSNQSNLGNSGNSDKFENNLCKESGICENFQFEFNEKTYLAHALVLNQGSSATSNALAVHQAQDLNFPDWRLVIALPADDFNYVIKQKGQKTLALAIVLALIASAFGIWFANRLNHSISGIARAAVKLGHGELNLGVIRTSFAEFNQISNELGHTADALRRSHDALLAQNAALEERVRARTIDLEHQTEQALQAANAKAAFLATMSHEIRTPMNGVIGMTDLLSGTVLTAEQSDYVDTIRASGDALLTIINDILDFSKIESGKMTLECEPFSLQQMIEDCIALMATAANQKKLELLYEFDTDVPKFIWGDITRVRQIVLNLLSNAVKFTEHGDVIIHVTKPNPMNGLDANNLVQIHVRDTGIGIPADSVEHLFSAFTQIDAATTRKYGGTGLGLAISRRLAELMGGDIQLQSEVGQGSVFSVLIQADAYDDEAAVNANPSDMAAREHLRSLQGRKVLLIDKNAQSMRIMCNRLRNYGMQVQTIHSLEQVGTIVSDALIAGAPQVDEALDLVIINIDQHQIPAKDYLQSIRSHANLAQSAVLALISQADSCEDELDQFGAAHLLKPVRESHLAEALLQLLFDSQSAGLRKHPVEEERRSGLPTLGQRFPLRMLIVDDNPTNRKVASMMLERLGYQAKTANDGREAVDHILAADASREAFDIVWMDLHMPVLDGLESTKIVRSSAIKQPTIIAVTAAAMHGDKEICLQSGMDDYVSKPLESKELQLALERYLTGHGFEIRQHEVTEPKAIDANERDNQHTHFDPNRFMAFCEGNPAYRNTFVGLIQNMVNKSPDQFEHALQAWKESRMEEAARIFHTMRGSMGTLGAIVFVDTSRELETAIKTGQTEEVNRLFVEIKFVLDLTLAQAQQWLNQQAGE